MTPLPPSSPRPPHFGAVLLSQAVFYTCGIAVILKGRQQEGCQEEGRASTDEDFLKKSVVGGRRDPRLMEGIKQMG